MPVGPRLVVLAQLDGTPFDPYRHGLDQTAALLEPILQSDIPIVFFSTRTRAELEAIHQELGFRHPFVAENGGALYVPRRYFGVRFARSADVAGYETLAYGRPFDQICTALTAAAQRLDVPITALNALSVREVAAECGLSLLQARLAKLRDHGELFRTANGAEQTLLQALRSAKLQCRPVGRFIHVSAEVDMGAVVDTVTGWYRRAFNTRVFVGFGHPQDDLAILRRVDVPLMWRDPAFPRGSMGRSSHQIETVEARVDALLAVVQRLTSTLETSHASES